MAVLAGAYFFHKYVTDLVDEQCGTDRKKCSANQLREVREYAGMLLTWSKYATTATAGLFLCLRIVSNIFFPSQNRAAEQMIEINATPKLLDNLLAGQIPGYKIEGVLREQPIPAAKPGG